MSDQQPASSGIPLLVTHNKKQTGKSKARVRPKRPLKKNGPPKRKVGVKRPIPAGDKVSSAPSILKLQKDGSTSKDAPTMGLNPGPGSSSDATKRVVSKGKVMTRKPIRKLAKPIRATKITSKRGLSVNAGSSMNKGLSIQAGSSRKGPARSKIVIQSQMQTQPQHEVVLEEHVQTQRAEGDQIQSMGEPIVVNHRAPPEVADDEPNDMDNTEELEQIEIIPYQHLGLIDPALNIAPPKPGEKTMKDFCSKFKIPRAQRTNNDENNNNGNNSNAEKNVANSAAAAAGSTDVNAPVEEEKDNRSGPLVEIINGEIVINESSMIVGGRQTMEEVDRELDGAVVVEENTGITATYNSFTKRQKSTKWSVEETRKFYLALRQCGTDFSTMESFFDGTDGGNKRTRKQLKGKYKRECRNNLNLIDMAMNPKVQLPMDMSVFGELDMEAVEAVVPLGQVSVNLGTDSNAETEVATAGTSGQTPGTTSTDTVVDVGEAEVVVETYGEDNPEPALVTQTQDANYDNTGINVDDTLEKHRQSTVEAKPAEEITNEEESNNIPLLAMPSSSKRKARPKFRARSKPKARKGSSAGRAKVKKTIVKK